MSDLIKVSDIKFPEKATKEHQSAIIAARGNKLKDYSPEALVQKVTLLIHEAKNITGQIKTSEDVIAAAVKVLVKKIKLGKGSLTEEQLEIAIEKGATGEYGEFMGINGLTIIKWVEQYFKDQVKFRKIQAEFELKEKLIQEQEEQAKHFKENEEKYMLMRFNREYNTLKEKPEYTIYDPNAAFYSYLIKNNLIEEPNPRLDHFKIEAENWIKSNWKNDLTNAKGIIRTRIKEQIDQFSKTLEKKPIENGRFEGKIKQLIVQDYCTNHIEIGSTFKEILGK